jgi:predicted ATP-dependent serine protease
LAGRTSACNPQNREIKHFQSGCTSGYEQSNHIEFEYGTGTMKIMGSGVAGLDEVLGGGFVSSSIILIGG